jgi:uncharacterized protein (DUF1015 family)
MRIYPFRALLPDKSIIASPSSFSGDVKMHFRNYIENGYINSRKKDEYFVYQIKSKEQTYRGLLACLDIDEVNKGKVLPHENTLHFKEQTSMQLILEREAIIKPLLLTYNPNKQIQTILRRTTEHKRPVQSFFYSLAKERHSIWPITDKADINELDKLFDKRINKVYIADGHHRCAVLNRLHQDKRKKKSVTYSKIISAFFDFENLNILDYNRMIEYADSMSSLELMALLSQSANIKPLTSAEKPRKKFEITCYMGNSWFRLSWKSRILKNYKSKVILDATILNDVLLKGILKVKNIESDQRIKYLPGTMTSREIETNVDHEQGTAAFCLFPISFEELQKQADKGKTLPPKSTFFEPRLPNGFISQNLGK